MGYLNPFSSPMVREKNKNEAHHDWAKGVIIKKGRVKKNGEKTPDKIGFHPYTRKDFVFGKTTDEDITF